MRKTKTRQSINVSEYEDILYYKLKNSRFKQQRLPAWRPVPTLCAVIVFYNTFAIIFIVLGIILLVYSSKIIKLEIPYSKFEHCIIGKSCNIREEIKDKMEPPIMVYYKLYGFYQNHRRYVRSKSIKQLYGEETTKEEMENDGDCKPIYTNKDIGKNISLNNTELDPKDVAIPCGIIAKTYFNDTFSNWILSGEKNEKIEVNTQNIAWEKDKLLFQNSNNISKQWINMKDEHFIVWMRPAGLPNFMKLWGRIEKTTLNKRDNISFSVENNYNITGNKSIVLSTTNEFGGKNTFLGVCFIVVGIISFILGICFTFIINKNKKSDNLKKTV